MQTNQLRPLAAVAFAFGALSTPVLAQGFFNPLADQPVVSGTWIRLATCQDTVQNVQVLVSDTSSETLVWDGCGFSVVSDQPRGMSLPPALASDPVSGAANAFGSTQGSGLVVSTFTGGGWSPEQDVDGVGRLGHTAIEMPAIGQTVVFGGIDANTNVLPASTLLWDGAVATNVTVGAAPSPRAFHAMSFDPTTGVAVLHGGADPLGPGTFGDTWLLSPAAGGGITWTQINAVGGPIVQNHGMMFDTNRGTHILFGGVLGSGAPNVEIIELDLAATPPVWTTISAAGGPLGQGQAVIYQDPGSENSVIAGTNAAGTAFSAEYGLESGGVSASPLVREQDCVPSSLGLSAVGQCATLGATVSIAPTGIAPGQPFGLFVDLGRTVDPANGCDLVLTPNFTPAAQSFAVPNNPALAGLDLFFQGATIDAVAGLVRSDVYILRLGN